jgi:hypothetical protein
MRARFTQEKTCVILKESKWENLNSGIMAGGAITTIIDGNLQIVRCEFTTCESGTDGGCVFARVCDFGADSCITHRNMAAHGGAFHCES